MIEVVQRAISDSIRRGDVHWDAVAVHDAPLQVDGMIAISRSVTTLAAKHIPQGTRRKAESCGLCDLMTRGPLDCLAHLPHLAELMCNAKLVCTVNNYPFCQDQLLISAIDHQRSMTVRQWIAIRHLFDALEIASGAFQTNGSGATVPNHAHISLFDERLPIHDLSVQPLRTCSRISVGVLRGYPAAALIVGGESSEIEMRGTAHLLDILEQDGHSSNVIMGHKYGTIVIPRRSERDPTTQRRVGNVEVGGILLANADGAPGTSESEIAQWMVDQGASALAAEYERILASTCLRQSEVNGLVDRAHEICCGSVA
jgi:hypothetical protein